MAEPQSYKNHTRRDVKFHLTLIPALWLNLAAAVTWTVMHRAQHLLVGFWGIGMAIVLMWMAVLARVYALQNQDRIIRLEERLRLVALLPAEDAAIVHQLGKGQLVALRFASDAELPALARRAVSEGLKGKQIKESIRSWRADDERI